MSPATPPSDRRRFPLTQWSQLQRLGNHHADTAVRLADLNALVQRYWKPVYLYVRAMRPVSVADAEDLTQGFFSSFLARVDFSNLSPERGRFRAFLKTSLRHYVLSEGRRQARQPQFETRFAFAEAEALWRQHETRSPDDAFDAAWGRELMSNMLARLQTELKAEGKQLYYQVFADYCLEPTAQTSYESVAQKYGCKPDDVRNYLRVVRRRGRELLKSAISEYLMPGDDLEQELRLVMGL